LTRDRAPPALSAGAAGAAPAAPAGRLRCFGLWFAIDGEQGFKTVSIDFRGAIDCDLHPRLPTPKMLRAHMDDFWRDTVEVRGIDVWDSMAYPANAPFTVRPDWRQARADANAGNLVAATLDRYGTAHAILNCLFPVQTFRDENLAAVFARATNDWIASEWLDKDPRLRASIVLPIQSVERSIEEIERRAEDQRFVQVLVLAMGESPLGKSRYWPIWAAAASHGLALGIHAGSSYHQAITGSGWPSYFIEDYAAQSAGFHTQLGSLICEGVFVKYPKLKVVLIESGVSWLPPYLWRLAKSWRGVRQEVPWLDRSPEEFVRDHVRLTVQPFDVPPGAAHIGRIMDQLQSDQMLLFASDFPHWQFDGDALLPPGLAAHVTEKILIDNALATYPRLGRSQ
jgi:predicted TIM-barrel fold metal-dependent hydrolase